MHTCDASVGFRVRVETQVANRGQGVQRDLRVLRAPHAPDQTLDQVGVRDGVLVLAAAPAAPLLVVVVVAVVAVVAASAREEVHDLGCVDLGAQVVTFQ